MPILLPSPRLLSPLIHSYITHPPTPTSLSYAATLFSSHHHSLSQQTPIFIAHLFRLLPATTVPEILLLGASNAGKSSLLNALLGVPEKRYASVSRQPGHTRTLQGFAVGDAHVATEKVGDQGKRVRVVRSRKGRGLVLVDAPGYGERSREVWGVEIEKYVSKRKVYVSMNSFVISLSLFCARLRRAFVLVDALVGIKPHDEYVLSMLSQADVPHQVILTKVDKLIWNKLRDAREGTPLQPEQLIRLNDTVAKVRKHLHESQFTPLSDILCTSAMTRSLENKEGRLGIAGLRWACIQAAGIEPPEQRRSNPFSDYDYFKDVPILEGR
jgi:GTP-binding protein